MIIIELFDFKVFQNYILPIVKKLMDQSRGDPLIRHALARNLAKLAKVGTRFIEVAQESAIELRRKIRDTREQMRQAGIRDSVSLATAPQIPIDPMAFDLGNNMQNSFYMMKRRTTVMNRVASTATAEGILAQS